MKNPAALTSSVASACCSESARCTSAIAARSVSSAAMPQAWPAPARQLGDGVVDTGLGAPDDHRAAAMVDDVDRDLPTHAGTATDDDDLLGLKMHIRVPSWFSLTAPTGPPLFRIYDANDRELRRFAKAVAIPPGAARTETAASPGELSSPRPPIHPGE